GPGGVSCQITFTSPHLVDPPRREAVKAHEGVGYRGRFVEVVQGRWCLEGPVAHEQRSGLPFQGGVGFCSRGDHWREVWEEMKVDHWEEGGAARERSEEVDDVVNRKV